MSGTIYQVKEWSETFENDRSRTRERCSFVCVPNKQHGMGFCRVMAEPDGAMIYGIFHLITGACSQQSLPRNGLLTADGEWTGSAWGVEDMALKFRRPASEIQRALEVLCSDRIDWIIPHSGKCLAETRCEFCEKRQNSPPAHRVVTVKSPPAHLEGIERKKEGKEGKDAPPAASHGEETPTMEAKRRIGRLFGRPEGFNWTNIEERAVYELVANRADWKEEFAVIECHRNTIKPEDLKFDFPRDVIRLLERWTSVLDLARSSTANGRNGRDDDPGAPPVPKRKFNTERYQYAPNIAYTVDKGPKREEFTTEDAWYTADICWKNWLAERAAVLGGKKKATA